MSATKSLTSVALAGAITAALSSFAVAGPAETKEMMATGNFEECYGVALAGKNGCAAPGAAHSCAGLSTVDYDGASFMLVPVGTCADIETPLGPGSLTPIDRPA
jgi:uncharacterized membrane protein